MQRYAEVIGIIQIVYERLCTNTHLSVRDCFEACHSQVILINAQSFRVLHSLNNVTHTILAVMFRDHCVI